MFAYVIFLLLSSFSTSVATDECSVHQLRLENSNILPMASCKTAVRNEIDSSKKLGVICSNIHCLEVINAKKGLTCAWFGQPLVSLHSTCQKDFSCVNNVDYQNLSIACLEVGKAEPDQSKLIQLLCAGPCKQYHDFLLTAKCNFGGESPVENIMKYFPDVNEVCQHTPTPTPPSTKSPSRTVPEDKKCSDVELKALASSNKAYADAYTKCEKFIADNGGDMTNVCEKESCKTKFQIMASSLKCRVDAAVEKMMKKCGMTSPNSTKEDGSNSNADSSTSTNVVSFMAMFLSSVVVALV